MQFVRYLISRFITFVLTVWIGVTIVFFVPRVLPTSDPVQAMLGSMQASQQTLTTAQLAVMKQTLEENFGLKGSLWDQYTHFLGRALFTHDFGPSLAMYPSSVNSLIAKALPYTLGLLLTVTIIAWLIGNVVGLIAGYRANKASSAILEALAMFLYPVPYPIFSLVLVILFSYVWPIFPFATSIHGSGWEFIGSILYNSVLPGLSILLVSLGWWVLSMKALSSTASEEDYVTYARLKGLSQRRIMTHYVMRNTMLPQITTLALSIGGAFSGALLTEVLFNYPGIGSLLYNAITSNDFNLMMGTVTLSIVAVAASAFIVDLAYPLLDPRIRNK